MVKFLGFCEKNDGFVQKLCPVRLTLHMNSSKNSKKLQIVIILNVADYIFSNAFPVNFCNNGNNQ